MTWVQVASLAFTVLAGILGAGWAIVRPLIKTLFEQVVVARFDSMEKKLDEVTKEHGSKIRTLELGHAKLLGALEARNCPAVPREGGPISRCAP